MKAGKAKVTNEKMIPFEKAQELMRKSFRNGFDESRRFYSEFDKAIFNMTLVELFEIAEEELDEIEKRVIMIANDLVTTLGDDIADINKVKEEINIRIKKILEEREMKAKYTDEVLIKAIEEGKNDKEILKDIPEGSKSRVKARIENLRKHYGALNISITEEAGKKKLSYGLQKAEELKATGVASVDTDSIMKDIESKNKEIASKTPKEEPLKMNYVEKAKVIFNGVLNTYEEKCKAIEECIKEGNPIEIFDLQEYNEALGKLKVIVAE